MKKFTSFEFGTCKSMSSYIKDVSAIKEHSFTQEDIDLTCSALDHYRVQVQPENLKDLTLKCVFHGRIIFEKFLKRDFYLEQSEREGAESGELTLILKVIDAFTVSDNKDKRPAFKDQHYLGFLYRWNDIRVRIVELDDEFLSLCFELMNEQIPYIKRWLNKQSDERDYGAVLSKIRRYYERFFGDLHDKKKHNKSKSHNTNESDEDAVKLIYVITDEDFVRQYKSRLANRRKGDLKPEGYRSFTEEWCDFLGFEDWEGHWGEYWDMLDLNVKSTRERDRESWVCPLSGEEISSDLDDEKEDWEVEEALEVDSTEVESGLLADESEDILDQDDDKGKYKRASRSSTALIRHEDYFRDMRVPYSRFCLSSNEVKLIRLYLDRRIEKEERIDKKQKLQEYLDVLEFTQLMCLPLKAAYAIYYAKSKKVEKGISFDSEGFVRFPTHKKNDDIFEPLSRSYIVHAPLSDRLMGKILARGKREIWGESKKGEEQCSGKVKLFTLTKLEDWNKLIELCFPGTFKGRNRIQLYNLSIYANATALTGEQLFFSSAFQYKRFKLSARYCWMGLEQMSSDLRNHALMTAKYLFPNQKITEKSKSDFKGEGVGSAKTLKASVIQELLEGIYQEVDSTLESIICRKGKNKNYIENTAKELHRKLTYGIYLSQDLAIAARSHHSGKLKCFTYNNVKRYHIRDKKTKQGSLERVGLEIGWGRAFRSLLDKFSAYFALVSEDVTDKEYKEFLKEKLGLKSSIREPINYFRHAVKTAINKIVKPEVAQSLSLNALGHFRNSCHPTHVQSIIPPHQEGELIQEAINRAFPCKYGVC